MKIIERLRQDHADILEAMDRVEALGPFTTLDALHRALRGLDDLRTLLQRHEAFEDACLARLSGDAAKDGRLRREIDRVSRENDDVLLRMGGLMEAMSGLVLRPAAALTEEARRPAEERLAASFDAVRDHIHRETVGLFFLALERLAEEIPAAPEAS